MVGQDLVVWGLSARLSCSGLTCWGGMGERGMDGGLDGVGLQASWVRGLVLAGMAWWWAAWLSGLRAFWWGPLLGFGRILAPGFA